jgi:hypothetical protein
MLSRSRYEWDEGNYEDKEKRNGIVMLYPKGSQNPGTQRIQATSRLAKIRWITRNLTMVVRLSSGRLYTWGLKGNRNAKLATIPHWRSTVLVKQVTLRFHRKLGRARKTVHRQLPINIHATRLNRGSESMCVEKR